MTAEKGNRTDNGTAWFVSPRIRQEADGRLRFRLEFNCRFERPRPVWWERLPEILERAGFRLERELDGSVEIFAPSSQYSASAVIAGSRTLEADGTDAMHESMGRILVELGLENVQGEGACS